MQVKQLELNLWEAIASAAKTPDEANLPKVFELLDLTLIEMDTRSQLRLAGDAVAQITDLFCDRTGLLFENLQAHVNVDGPVMPDTAFDRYVRQSMVVDFEQFLESLESLPRRTPEKLKEVNSIVASVAKEVLLQVLEQENLLSAEQELELVLATAHTENVSVWIDAITNCLRSHVLPITLLDLLTHLQLPIVEIWLGLLLGNFKLRQRGSFYDLKQIWIDCN